MRSEAADGSRTNHWLLPAALVVLAGAGWLRTLDIPYLAVCGAATALALVLLARANRPGRWPAAFVLAATAFLSVAVLDQRAVHRAEVEWNEYRSSLEAGAMREISRRLDQTARSLRDAAATALEAPDEPTAAFDHLSRTRAGPGERAVVLYRDGMPLAWTGRGRIRADSLTAPMGVAFNDFYVSLYATARRGRVRAVALALLHADPPADRLSTPLDLRIASRTGVPGFEYAATGSADASYRPFVVEGDTLLAVRPRALVRGEVQLRIREQAQLRGALTLAVALVLLLIAAWRRPASLLLRVGTLATGLATVAAVPLNTFSNASRLFDPTFYFTALGGPLTGSVAALALSSALILLGLFALLRANVRLGSRWSALALVTVIASLGPFLLRDLSRGIAPPPYGVPATLWLAWEVALFLAATATLLAGLSAGRAVLGRRRGLEPVVAPAVAGSAALLAPVLWEAPGRWPAWYPVLWIAAIIALAFMRRSRGFVVYAAMVAAFGAATLVWGATARKRVALAERDVAGLNAPDPAATLLLERLARDLEQAPAPTDRADLLAGYVSSDLAAAGYPVELTTWRSDSSGRLTPDTELVLAEFEQRSADVVDLAEGARRTGRSEVRRGLGPAGVQVLLAVPHDSARVTTVAVAPRTRLIRDDPFTALIGLSPAATAEPLYTLTLAADARAATPRGDSRWQRQGDELHGDWLIATSRGPTRVHVEVELRPLAALLQRGALVVLLDLLIISALWTVAASADGGLLRWARTRVGRWTRSYRARLTIALFGFFVVPAVVFAIWSYRRLQNDDRQSRELLVRETLRAAAASNRLDSLELEGDRLGAPLFAYEDGALRRTSDPLYDELAPVGRYLRPDVYVSIVLEDEVTTSRREQLGGLEASFGYRAATDLEGTRLVLSAPARSDELALDRQRRDLGTLVLFATAVGALAALGLSGIAARGFARPIGSLRRAALAIAAGEREPLLAEEPPSEFRPVFSAFRRMAADLAASRGELEEAQRRTESVLRNVASGVVGVDRAARVSLANPRAESLLGHALPPQTRLADVAPGELATRLRAFVVEGSDEEEELDIELNGRQLHCRLTRLMGGGGGAVLTIDDVTELARAQRVIAWGEMARQVAHEIKNPLTPIRLGVQHLKRARADSRVDFDRVLDQNVGRILDEIDRLDEIARAFSRYGMAPAERSPGRATDVSAIVRDVVELERMGEGDVSWSLAGADDPTYAIATGDELREVLLNVLENARLARARRVDVQVARRDSRAEIVISDDGEGIPPEVLPKIFEPHFSTRTSGSGLGLAISRSLVDGWGGGISVESERGEGTTVTIVLAASEPV